MTDSAGLVGPPDGLVIKIKPGDTVACPLGQQHWHGAAAARFMSHLALLEVLPDGEIRRRGWSR